MLHKLSINYAAKYIKYRQVKIPDVFSTYTIVITNSIG